jgi:outer membrane protein OmpA-like peptidoglycan-associated protein
VLTEKKIEILDVVHFEFGKAVIRPESFPLLRDVAQVLRDNPGVKQVRVEGHTDDVGNDRKNLTLSQQRAESVRDFLVREGIDAARLAAKGYGETKPVATNKTDEGRAKNRRVEFVILSGPGDVQAK